MLNQPTTMSEYDIAINKLRRELRMCRNELCLKCGDYKNAHNGACDGCRWKRPEWMPDD